MTSGEICLLLLKWLLIMKCCMGFARDAGYTLSADPKELMLRKAEHLAEYARARGGEASQRTGTLLSALLYLAWACLTLGWLG